MTIFRKWMILCIGLFVLLPVFSIADTGLTILTPTPAPTQVSLQETPIPESVQETLPAAAATTAPIVVETVQESSAADVSSDFLSIPTPKKQQLNPTYGVTVSSSSSSSDGTAGSVSIAVDTSSSSYFEDDSVPAYMPFVTMAPLAETEAHYSLPIDFSGGKVPLSDGYITDYEYQDPTIHVKIERGREDDCTFWICEVRIADASQLRTASADGFDSNMTMPGAAIAKRVNAVVAIDGDYFCYTGRGYIMRQGQLFLDKTTGGRDVLLIDEDGDFHIIRKAKKNECQPTIDGKKVINAFFFGPVLVEDSIMGTEFRYTDMAYDLYSQRMAIAQVGKLHYKIICCESPKRGSSGMTLKQFASFCQDKGVKTAYNLDGGDSTMLIFRNRKLNDVDNPHTREIADIIYFASAYTQE